jgi:DNA gyrase/topoisomerase IV subunit B
VQDVHQAPPPLSLRPSALELLTKARAIGDDVAAGVAMLLSLFMRNPQFQGQTKERLASAEATRLVEGAVRDHFDHWLGADPATSRAPPTLRSALSCRVGRRSAT